MSIIALLSYLLQSSFLEYAKIYGIKPNLIIITTISYALVRGSREGAIYGLFSGLLLDVMGGKYIGLYAIMGMYLGLIIGSLNKNLYNENYLIPIMVTAGSSFVYSMIVYVSLYFIPQPDEILWYTIGYIIPEAIYNTILSIFVYFFILYINKKLDYYSKTSRSY